MKLRAIPLLSLLPALMLVLGACSDGSSTTETPSTNVVMTPTVSASVTKIVTVVPTTTVETKVEVDQQESRTEEQDATFWNKPMWDGLPECTTDFGFSHQLVAAEGVGEIMFGPGSHVWPHEHMTYWGVAGEAGVVQLYAPTDIFRIDIRTGSLSDLEEDPYTEWGAALYLCDGHTLGLGHIAEPSDVILAILGDAERECDGDHFAGCRWNTETFIPAGTPIFKSSHYVRAFDVGLRMAGLTAEQLQELPGYGYSITPWRTPGGNAVCSLEYFPEPIRLDYLNLLLGDSTCGPFNQDVPGTAMGYWMPSPSPDIFPSLPSERDVPAEEEIIWLHQTVTESSMHTISVGSTTFGLDFGHYVYTTSSTGLVNSRWDLVKPSHTYCTELQKKINHYMWEDDVERILLTRLSEDGASLTVEATNNDKCGEGPWGFQGGERTFYR